MDSNFFISIFDSIPLLVIISPIIILSIISMAVFVERFIFFRSVDRELNSEVMDDVFLNIKNDRLQDALESFKSDENTKETSPYHGFISEIIGKWSDGDNEILIRSVTEKMVSRFEKFAGVVSTIATVAPMLGLFGTVTGMMKSFSALSKLGSSVQSNLAAGITEALITTALGLLVAIPSVIFYNYLVSKLEKHLRYMEILANSFLELSNGNKS